MIGPPPLVRLTYHTRSRHRRPSALLGLAGMVCGLASLPLMCLVYPSVPVAAAAVVIGGVVHWRARRGVGGGGGLATAGILCGTVTLVTDAALAAVWIADRHAGHG